MASSNMSTAREKSLSSKSSSSLAQGSSKQSEAQSGSALVFLLSTVFFCSGMAALFYQLAWQRVLTQYYGVGCTSVTMIVCVYMLGLGLGALIGGALAKKVSNLVGLYFGIELLIAFFGFSSLPILQMLGTSTAGASLPVSFSCMLAFLGIPTLLMGTTLPILTEILMRLNSSFLASVSSLYFFNTLGASTGALIGVFFLITVFGLDGAVYTAAAINTCLAVIIAACIPKSPLGKPTEPAPIFGGTQAGEWAYLYVFTTGFIAIAYEIVWFRTVEILIKASPYAFGIVLAVYLLGIALGSYGMNKLTSLYPRFNNKSTFLGIQCLIALYGVLSYGLFFQLADGPLKGVIETSFRTELHPSFDAIKFSKITFAEAFAYLDFLIWPSIFMLVPTMLMGASFPLISELARSKSRADGETLGRVYFWNVMGNVAGAIGAGFVLLQRLGTASTVLFLFCLAMPFAFLLFRQLEKKSAKATLLAATLGLTAWCVMAFPSSEDFIKAAHVRPTPNSETFVQEGTDCVVVTYRDGQNIWHYLNGLAHGGRPSNDPEFTQRAVEAMTYAKSNAQILIIGYGTGAIAEGVLKSPEVKKLTIVELNHSAIANLRKLPALKSVIRDPRVELVIDDGRRFLNRMKSKYDVVLMDPLRSKTAYSTNIYSTEFFALVRKHLNPGGALMVWQDNLDVLPRTVASAFNHTRLYKWFCLGSDDFLVPNLSRQHQLRSAFPQEFQTAMKNSDSYIGDENKIRQITQGYPINRDLKPHCEYYISLDALRRRKEELK